MREIYVTTAQERMLGAFEEFYPEARHCIPTMSVRDADSVEEELEKTVLPWSAEIGRFVQRCSMFNNGFRFREVVVEGRVCIEF